MQNTDQLLDALLGGKLSADQRDTMTARDVVTAMLAGKPVELEQVQPAIETAPAPALGERLRYYRNRAKLSSTAVGRSIGCAQSSVIQMEKGKHRPSPEVLLKLAALYSIPVSELTGDDPACAAAIELAGDAVVTMSYMELILANVIEPLTARVTELEARLAQYEGAEPIYTPTAALNVPYKPKRELAGQIVASLSYGPLYVAELHNRFPGYSPAEVDAALCRLADSLADGYYIGYDGLVMLEDVPEPIRPPRRGAPQVWLDKIQRAKHFRRKARA